MKFRVAKDTLIEGLQTVQNVISTRTTLPILLNVQIVSTGNVLELSATDLDVGITCRIEAQVTEQGGTTLPAKRLLSIIRELPSSEIEIEVDSKQFATIKSGQSFFKIAGISRDEFPPITKLENPKQFRIEQALLRDMLKKTSYAISHDETRYVLNGTFLSFRDKKLTLVATDGRRLALTENELDFPASQESDIIIPTKAVNELQRLLKDEESAVLSVAENKITIELNNTIIVSKLIDGKYPNYKQVIPAESKERVTLEREQFHTAVRRVALLTSEKHNSIKMTIGNDNLEITSTAPDIGEARESIPVKYRGRELVIAFNPEYIVDALKSLTADQVHFDFSDELSPGVMRIDASSFLYVIMPMRVG